MMTVRFIQVEGIHEEDMDGELFLVDADYNVIFNLNNSGAMIWRLLDEPMSVREIAQVLKKAYKDTPPMMRLEKDINEVLDEFFDEDLIEELDQK